MLYNVKQGSSNKSFGVEVARLAGFPAKVLSDANKFLDKEEISVLKMKSEFEPNEVKSFLDAYGGAGDNKKRKSEMALDFHSKIFKRW